MNYTSHTVVGFRAAQPPQDLPFSRVVAAEPPQRAKKKGFRGVCDLPNLPSSRRLRNSCKLDFLGKL